jgi:hypothetical protein
MDGDGTIGIHRVGVLTIWVGVGTLGMGITGVGVGTIGTVLIGVGDGTIGTEMAFMAQVGAVTGAGAVMLAEM